MGESSTTRAKVVELSSSSESVDKTKAKGKEKVVVVDVDADIVKNSDQEKEVLDDHVIKETVPIAWRPPPPPGFSRESLTSSVFRDCRFLGLPPGWRLEIKPRTSTDYIGTLDQYYYEPGTNAKFRSLKSVLNYLRATGQSIHLPTQLPAALIKTDLYNDPVIKRQFRSVNKVLRHLRAGQPPRAPPPPTAAAAAAGQQINNEQATRQQNQATPHQQQPTQQGGGQPADEVYYKPGTNKQFRSPKAVLRHLQATGKKLEELPRALAVAPQQINNEQAQRQGNEVNKPADHQLPVLQLGDNSEVYCKPGTNKPFRSPKAVLRYLQATGKNLEELPRAPVLVVGQQIKNSIEQAQRQGNEVNSDHQLPIQQGDKSEVAESSCSRKKLGIKRKAVPSSCSESNHHQFVNPLHAWATLVAGNDQRNPIVVEDYIPRKDLWTQTFGSVYHPNERPPKLQTRSKGKAPSNFQHS